MAELVIHDLGSANTPTKNGLVNDYPEFGRLGLVEDQLTLQPGAHKFFDLIVAGVA